jgi:ribosomal protein L29
MTVQHALHHLNHCKIKNPAEINNTKQQSAEMNTILEERKFADE